jgi:biotin synthase
MPKGLGITLSVGEQSVETYKRFYAAGAHRYLLRIETSNPELYAAIHPAGQDFLTRVKALSDLKKAGFQVGTGVMIGLPGQTEEDLADDLLFFQEMDVDMIGMGPYIVHGDTPMAAWSNVSDRTPKERFDLALRMIAATRLLLRDANIAAATALQAIDPVGREEGLRWGANIIMPQVTPLEVRHDYLLYDNKPCLDESAEHCRSCLAARIGSIGREVGYDSWGDSWHYKGKV